MSSKKKHSSSFRDPSGYVFLDDGIFKRCINPVYFNTYNKLKNSGFFDKLFKNDLLIKHTELSNSETEIIIQPEQISFITYPYEWSFNQYKEAALLTLKIQKFCLQHDYSLKDASAFNVAFHKGKAIFIDSLSFDLYIENSPWRAYKQFITHFLGPLLLASYHGSQSLKMMSSFIDGIPVKMVASMLPFKTKLNPFLYSNIHLLAKFEDKHKEGDLNQDKALGLSKKRQLNIIDSLFDYVKNIELKEDSEWGNYYNKINYSDTAFKQKSLIINNWIEKLKIKTLIDIGGNDGTFVRFLKSNLDLALVGDIDNNAVDQNYTTIKKHKENYILPFILDVLSPSAGIGFNNKERLSFLNRIKDFNPDLTLALAVIHHISLSGNVTFKMSAIFFASFSKNLIIEFPKREDSWVQKLLSSKLEFKDQFDYYNIDNFEKEYSNYFNIVEKIEINDSERVIYLMNKK